VSKRNYLVTPLADPVSLRLVVNGVEIYGPGPGSIRGYQPAESQTVYSSTDQSSHTNEI
jgi:hypothetical protein